MNDTIYAKRDYLAMILATIILILFSIAIRNQPPAPLDAGAPSNQFSAERAFNHLTDLLKENIPHPAGSAQNDIIRGRIVEKFTNLGYEVEQQSGLGCGFKYVGCSTVTNIIAVKKGKTNNPAVLITSHYDSVPATAAAGDDGMGVASILEIARIVLDDSQAQNDIIFLITDAEEVGLKGAALFVDEHPLMPRVGAVISMESRGVTGPSMMFETSNMNNGLMDLFIDNIERPVANSLTYEIYKRMPNDTDYSVFKAKDIKGFNFAISGGVTLYHSVRDDLNHLDKGSLQHQGQNALGILRALSNVNLVTIDRSQDATYFDLFSFTMVKWSSAVGKLLSVLTVLAALAMVASALQRGMGKIDLFFAFLSIPTLIGLTLLMGWLLSFPLGHWADIHPLEHPYPWSGRFILIASLFLVSLYTARWFRNIAGIKALININWLFISLVGCGLAFTISGASYLFVAPALMFTLGLSLDYLKNRTTQNRFGHFEWATHLGFIGATYIAFALFFGLELVFNFQFSHLRIIPLIILGLALTPLLSGYFTVYMKRFNPLSVTTGIIILFSYGVYTLVPTYTDDRPRSMNLVHMQNSDTGEAKWIIQNIGKPDFDYLKAAGFPSEKSSLRQLNLYEGNSYNKDAQTQDLTAAEFTLVSDTTENGERIIKGTISSPRGAYQLRLGFAKETPINGLKINGQQTVNKDSPMGARATMIPLHGPGREAYDIEISLPEGTPIELVLMDINYLDKSFAKDILIHRPSNTQPVHSGDYSVIYKTYKF